MAFTDGLERAAKIRKIAVYCFLISFLVPELYRFKDQKVPAKAIEIKENHKNLLPHVLDMSMG